MTFQDSNFGTYVLSRSLDNSTRIDDNCKIRVALANTVKEGI